MTRDHARTRYILDMPWPVAVLAGLSACVFAGVVTLRVLVWPVTIPSGSMQPTLDPGDFLFVEKFAYVGAAVPARGDIVAFRPVTGESQHQVFIKRVVGGPGDVVQMIDGALWVNGARVSAATGETRPVEGFGGESETVKVFAETPRPGLSHRVWDRAVTDGDATEPYETPPGMLFVLGDDRDNSSDSRFEMNGFGFVPASEVVGRVTWKLDPASMSWSRLDGR